jgi:hypothetical protein
MRRTRHATLEEESPMALPLTDSDKADRLRIQLHHHTGANNRDAPALLHRLSRELSVAKDIPLNEGAEICHALVGRLRIGRAAAVCTSLSTVDPDSMGGPSHDHV